MRPESLGDINIILYSMMGVIVLIFVGISVFAKGGYKFLMRNRLKKRIDWKRATKIYLSIIGILLFCTVNNPKLPWYNAVILGSFLFCMIIFSGISNMDKTKEEQKYMDNLDDPLHKKMVERDKKINSILRKGIF